MMRTGICPWCASLHDDVPDLPDVDVVLCEYCGNFSFLDELGRLHKPSARGLAVIEANPRLIEVRREWRANYQRL